VTLEKDTVYEQHKRYQANAQHHLTKMDSPSFYKYNTCMRPRKKSLH